MSKEIYPIGYTFSVCIVKINKYNVCDSSFYTYLKVNVCVYCIYIYILCMKSVYFYIYIVHTRNKFGKLFSQFSIIFNYMWVGVSYIYTIYTYNTLLSYVRTIVIYRMYRNAHKYGDKYYNVEICIMIFNKKGMPGFLVEFIYVERNI